MTHLLKNLIRLPSLVALHLLGLAIAITGEFESLSLLILGILVGLAASPLVGAIVGFGLYIVIRQVGAFVNAIAASHRYSGDCTEFLAKCVRDHE